MRPHVNTERSYFRTTVTAGMECDRMYFDLHQNSCRDLHEGFLLLLQKRVVSGINWIPYESIHLDFDNLVPTCHGSDKPLLDKSPDSLDTVITISPPRDGLYCRTKRVLGLKRGPINPYEEPRTRTPTGAILDRVTSTLRKLPQRAFSRTTSAATSVQRLHYRSPWAPRSAW